MNFLQDPIYWLFYYKFFVRSESIEELVIYLSRNKEKYYKCV